MYQADVGDKRPLDSLPLSAYRMGLQRAAGTRHVSPQKSTAEASQPSDCRQPAVAMAMAVASPRDSSFRVLSGALDSFPREALEKEEEMFDLNEPADEPLAPEASAARAAAAEEQDRKEKDLSPARELDKEEEEEGACSGLSLLAHTVEQWKPIKRALEEEAQEQGAVPEIQASQEEIQLEKPGSECRGLLPAPPSEENDDDLNAKQWRLSSSATIAAAAAKEQQRSASWPRSQRPAAPALVRSTSFQMLFRDERADDNAVDSNGRAGVGEEEEPKNTTAPGNLCEFFPIENDHPSDNVTKNTTDLEVSHDKICSSIDLIDAREEKTSITTLEESSPAPPPLATVDSTTTTIATKNNNASSETMIHHDHSDPLDDSKFVSVIWQGQINFQDVKVPSMVAACSRGWQHVFKNRKVADDLTVQRCASTDKFLGAVKEYVAEPGVKVTQRSSGASSPNLNKLVEFLVGGGTGNDPGLSLKGPLVAVVPLHDEDKVWLADLYLVPASALSEAEPGELSSSDEDFLYGFVSLSPAGDGEDESFAWLKDEASNIDDEPVTSSKKDVLVEDKPPPAPNVDLSGDSKHQQQDLEEGQLVSEDQGGKEAAAYASYDRRKRYGEDEKKSKSNGGEAEGKARDRHRHRDHERDKEQDRERLPRRDRDREADHRDRDTRDNRESVYARRSGNYDYLPRLDTTKGGRHRDGDKDRGPHTWENGGRGGQSGRERVRSRSKEREKERERLPPPPPPLPPVEKNAKDARGKKVTVVEPSKKHEAFDKKKRERSPDYKGSNGKRLKEAEADKHDDGRAGRKGRAEVDGDYPLAKMQGKEKGEVTKHHHQGSEERAGSSPDRKGKEYTIVTGEDENEAYAEMFVRSCDPDIRTWVPSVQNARHLREDYGVTLLMDVMEPQQEALHLKLSSRITESCPSAEARYFVRRAAEALGDVVQRGVFSKILWYPGQLDPLSVASVVRKLQGDGEEISSIDRIQESTSIMVGVVLDGDAKKSAKVGLRLSSARKNGLARATKQTLELLDQVAMEIAKESIPPPGESKDGKLSRRPLYVTNCPDYASPRMLKGIFENVLRERVKKTSELPPGFEQSPDMVSDVKYASEDSNSFFVEFSSDELLEATLQIYTADRDLFCGLKVELPSPAAMKVYDMLVAEDQRGKAVADRDRDDFGTDLLADAGRRKVKPLYLTELGKYTSADQVRKLFEEVIASHINQSLDGKLVTAIRHVPSRGCMFVDLATPELVEYMLDLHNRHPEEFGHMKMELGRSNDGVEKKRSFAALDRARSDRNMSPTPRLPKRRAPGGGDDGDEGEDGYGGRRKQRSDPEKTVYADHLPENSSDAVIRKIFRAVLLEHMTSEQKAELGDEVVTEVRHVKAKYCAFVVFVSEDLARLALELYSRDEEIFDHMRLKPHFNSKLEDMYREDGHDRDDEPTPHSSNINNNNSSSSSAIGATIATAAAAVSKSVTPEFDLQDSRGRSRGGGGGGNGVFKEVDRRRSVYVDRIPDKYPETAIKEVLDRFLRRKGRGSPSYVVSHVSFFRDKYDSSKLCAFVEVRNEDAVQDLLDCYNADEGAFEGMRIRPAVKYSHG
ncbi:uncharacterized protein LOC112348429 [Selaginella moellendorffii]|uniref:uncharacterized protein LOC112348429 n=1 Tax=Selaginella moellendorffii TaxID=88036 RepID=UPI000D1C2EFE|nr:uncharacterized protein LOC112348429 [Selaginella moellendorffii]|eukprot:XP_024536646.1 uncharacterized protein LOC112348429 [Selaginella moellendorffii]